jgi:Tol biopolymer transport system component/catechol 2,3-dioxygenase-like lactoylglutathione lyase family enzyme
MRAQLAAGIFAAAAFLLWGGCAAGRDRSPGLGVFESQSDLGSVVPAGTGKYDPATGTYTLTSAGANTWYRVDDFHYVWKKAVGDLSLTADVSFPPHAYGHEPDPHRKGILMFRQTLDAGGVYADVGVHGSGLVALQYRTARGANTQDVELNIEMPKTVRLEKRGDVFTLFLSMKGEPLHQVGASITLHLKEPFYVGLGAVSHDVATTDKVEFAHVTLQAPAPVAQDAKSIQYSTLQTISIDDQFRRAMMIRTVPGYLQSANWAPDRKSIYVHEEGRVTKIPYLTPDAGGPPQAIDVGALVGCSGNFGLSPDGKWLAVSCAETKGGPHEVYILPAAGGSTPRKLTKSDTSSFFHAWAPDSQTVAFTRGRAAKADIFTIPLSGGAEVRLTSDTTNDGPDYSPDGKLIYFDSSRSGTTQLWRMKPDGSAAEQITDDANLNSSPHVSPDGKAVAFLSQPTDSDQNMSDVALKVLNTADGMLRTIVDFRGNRGSLSMYSWGDAKHLAFVSYQALPTMGSEAVAAAGRPAITGVSHIAVYAADAAKSERFYVHDLGGIRANDPEHAGGVRYYFAPTQFVEVLPLPNGPASINRLDHVAFTTPDVRRLRDYLAAKQVTVPQRTERGSDGSEWLDVLDPEGNKIEFVQPPGSLAQIPANPLSSHIIHVGFIVHDRAREDRFFRTVLGFKPYWFGGMKDDAPTWISQQVPDGTDWLEYMIVGTPDGHGIPATMSAGDLGVLNHFSLGVLSTQNAYTMLWNGDRLTGQANTPKIGRDAKWQLNLLDPDGTRAELMELHAIGKPCCSAFTAADPQE